jgi:hypothetical protein
VDGAGISYGCYLHLIPGNNKPTVFIANPIIFLYLTPPTVQLHADLGSQWHAVLQFHLLPNGYLDRDTLEEWFFRTPTISRKNGQDVKVSPRKSHRRKPMSRASEQHKAEMEQYRQIKAYYDSIRRPVLERITFALALVASIVAAGRILGLWLTGYGQWVAVFYGVSLIAFVGLDSVIAPAHHPVPLPLGGFNPSRIYEKFSVQERAWQILVVLMLPVTARLIAAFMFAAR